jgi:ABC-type glycerol-3-phosphate transport system permease component
MLFACFIPFQSVIIPMAVILGFLGQFENQLTDMTGFNFDLGNPTVNLVIVHVVYGLGFTTLFSANIWNNFLFGSTFAAGDQGPMTVALTASRFARPAVALRFAATSPARYSNARIANINSRSRAGRSSRATSAQSVTTSWRPRSS